MNSKVVHRPEAALCSGRLGRLRRPFRVRMNFHQRVVPEHQAQTSRIDVDQMPQRRLGLDARRALVVAVFEQRELGVRVAQHMIGSRQSRLGQCRVRSRVQAPSPSRVVCRLMSATAASALGSGQSRLAARAIS